MQTGEAFLKNIEGWRATLARNLAVRNASLASDDLTAAVQLTIARAVFLRMAEDRGLEPHQQLLKLCDQPEIYVRFMRSVCRRADEKYGSGLFHFEKKPGITEPPDPLTPALAVDDRVFKPILQSLYAARGSSANVRVLPAEILGTVYERFLGRVIRRNAGRQAEFEEQPHVRKADGVYYTPAYIVEYIVRHTVGRQIEGRSPAQLAGGGGRPPLRVLDLACGGGAFLLGTYQRLLDHCQQWYREHQPERHPQAVHQEPCHGEWRLTNVERLRLLTTHVFGVDIDPLAVEVAKASLLLKALEGGDDGPHAGQLRLFPDHALPNLADNIKCGNALIGPDFCTDQSTVGITPERRRINALDWQSAFPHMGPTGGFDAVIGNPPYVNARTMLQEHGPEVKRYFAQRYQTARRGYDMYVLFVEKALEVLGNGGRLGMILPNKIATLDYAEACRALLLERTTLECVADVSALRVFPTAGVYPYIIVARKGPPSARSFVRVLQANSEQDLLSTRALRRVKQRDCSAAAGFSLHGTLDVESRVATQPLARRAKLHSGTTGFAAQRLAEGLCERTEVKRGEHFEFIVSGNIDRYSIALGNVRFIHRQFNRPVLPANLRQLTESKRRLFRQRKLVLAGMTKRLEAAWDAQGGLALGVSVYAATEMLDNPLYLLGVLNSKLLSYLFRIRFQAKRLAGGFLAINKGQLAKLPIRVIDFAVAEDKRRHDRIVALAQQMSTLLSQPRDGGHAALTVERQIASIDTEIDRLVYSLYALTEDEVQTIETSVRS